MLKRIEAIEPLSPFIVTGVGRTGTSTVARVLHENLGVRMMGEHNKKSPANPDGFYEDLNIWALNMHFVSGKINFPLFFNAIQRVIDERDKTDKIWGFKDPVLANILGFYYTFFVNPKIIICERPKNLVLKSLVKHWRDDEYKCEELYNSRITCLDRFLKGRDHLAIRFGKDRKTDEEIEAEIKNKWGYIWD